MRRAAWLMGLLIVLGMALAAHAQDSASPSWDGTLRRIRVPILMYHYISEPPPDADVYRIDLSVPPALFRQHLDYLAGQGYHTITLGALVDALMTGAPLPTKPIVLTFDDGYVDNYTAAFPLLREFGFTGTFFVMTSGPDSGNPAYMAWAQITDMAAAGMQMESHTRDHPDLRGRDTDFLVYQLLGASESLAAWTGVTPDALAYPAGQYDESVIAMLHSMGVRAAVTTDYGMWHTTTGTLDLPRVRMRNTTDVNTLAALLSG